jgi:transcriptional regulator with XRE-family HTH domain
MESKIMAVRIKRLRKRAGLTQEELAKACNVSRSAVALWETEQVKTLRPEHLFAAADALGVDAKYLATGVTPLGASFSELPAPTRNMLDAYMRLPVHLQEHIGQLVKSMASPMTPIQQAAQDELDEIARGKRRS